MKADGWLYLCAAHPSTQSCPAIDYIIHTLDGATVLLNNSKYFPSRISIPEPSLKHFQSVARRLYRIFAHAYFHHREIYEFFENDTHLYARFLLLSRTYGLIPSSLINIPDTEDAASNNEEEEEENNSILVKILRASTPEPTPDKQAASEDVTEGKWFEQKTPVYL
ncbi:hypothetical protein G6F68_011900 [Rhizopus microsporus]|nr:hypothetical protein G6F68_011900 [Rhizopus microsporus]